MVKKRPGRAKQAYAQQAAETRRGAPGKRFVGDGGDPAHARAAERAKVQRMQTAAREAAVRASHDAEEARLRDERQRQPLWETVGALVLESARLAATVAGIPLRMARAAAEPVVAVAGLPFRVARAAAGMLPRLREA